MNGIMSSEDQGTSERKSRWEYQLSLVLTAILDD